MEGRAKMERGVRNSKWGTMNAEDEFKYGSQSDRRVPESGPGFVFCAPPPPAYADNKKRKEDWAHADCARPSADNARMHRYRMIALELPVQFHLLCPFFTARWELGLRLRAVESLGHAELTRAQPTFGDRQGRKPIGYGHRPVVDVLDYRESLLFFRMRIPAAHAIVSA